MSRTLLLATELQRHRVTFPSERMAACVCGDWQYLVLSTSSWVNSFSEHVAAALLQVLKHSDTIEDERTAVPFPTPQEVQVNWRQVAGQDPVTVTLRERIMVQMQSSVPTWSKVPSFSIELDTLKPNAGVLRLIREELEAAGWETSINGLRNESWLSITPRSDLPGAVAPVIVR